MRLSDRFRQARDAIEDRPRLRSWFPAVLLAGMALLFYWPSAVAYVNGGNWGEFQTFGYLGGVAHSPTYPLLTGAIFVGSRVVWFVEPAHAANIVNATFAALAAVLLFVVARDITGSWVAALTAAVVFATGFRIWEDAVQAEAFSLQGVLALGVAVALRAFQRRPTPGRAAGVAFATGLSLANHGLSVFVLPFTLAYVLLRRPLRALRPREVGMSAGAFVLGLTPWVYLLRARWTEVVIHKPEIRRLLDFRDMWDQVVTFTATGAGTGVGSSLDNLPNTLELRWQAFAADVLREYGWIWVAAIIAGFFFVAARDWRFAIWTLGTAVFAGSFAILYQIPDYDRYFSLIYVILGIWLAGGLALLLTTVRTAVRRLGFDRLVQPAVYVISIAILVGAGAHVGVQMTGDARQNISAHWEHAKTHYLHARSHIQHMVPNSVYMTNWTSSWYPRYVLHVEGFGSDKNIEIWNTAYETMGIDRAEEILQSGQSLYLQRTTRDYERDFIVVPEGSFFQVFLPADVQDGELVKGDTDRIYLIEDGKRRWIPSLEIFRAHSFAWGRIRVLEERDIARVPEGPPLEMPKRHGARSSTSPCPPTCVTVN